MYNWRTETAFIGRYAGGGMLNTLAGFAIIFLMMAIGFSPFIANFTGYLTGLVIGFFVSKKIVFRSEGHLTAEGLRYLAAFLACYLINLWVLQFMLDVLHSSAALAQIGSAAAYTVIMYLLTRWVVFHPAIKIDRPKD